MTNPLRFSSPFAAAVLLGSALASAPAHAASFTVFWDREAFGGFTSGYGVTQTTAQNASSAGIPIVNVSSVSAKPSTLVVQNTLDESTLTPPFPIGAGPATITSNWSATNNTGINSGGTPQNLYLVFERPGTNTIDLNGQPQSVTYNPADVGLTLGNDGNGLGVDWVILQVPVAGGNSVYYPAVSLGTLPNGALPLNFQLFYTLNNPQVFTENFNYLLGMPLWSLDFASITAPIPEPSSGVLMLVGLLGIARCRRQRS
jgi:hypothetical protein